MVEKEEEKMIDSEFITPVKPLSVKKAKTKHEVTDTATEPEMTETSTEHKFIETLTEHEIAETSTEPEVTNTAIELEITDTATVLKRKTPEPELNDSVFKNEDVGDLGPTPQKTIPKISLIEIKNHLTQKLRPVDIPHTFQVRFINNVFLRT